MQNVLKKAYKLKKKYFHLKLKVKTSKTKSNYRREAKYRIDVNKSSDSFIHFQNTKLISLHQVPKLQKKRIDGVK